MRVALFLAVLLVAAVFTAEAVKNRKRRRQRKALRLNQKGILTTPAAIGNPSMAPNLKPSKVCIQTDKVLTGSCYPWVYAATSPFGTVPLSGSVVVVRDTTARRTWLEAEIVGVLNTNFHAAIAHNFPCNIQRGGPFPYQHYEHGAAYGLDSYIDNDGNVVNASVSFGGRVEFQGNLLNATRPDPNAPPAMATGYTYPLVFSNGGYFDYIARNEIQSIVIYEASPDAEAQRIMCCDLFAKTNKPKVKKDKKDKKDKTTEAKKTTKKQAN